jgi:putative transposase
MVAHRESATLAREGIEPSQVLDAAFLAHPERFVRGAPKPALPPAEVWINKPASEVAIEDAAQ